MRKFNVMAFIISLIATSGSLYFSEVMRFIPCELCWYQRILMYPLVALFLVAIVRKSKDIYYYTLPLTTLGMGIAFYQYSLQKSLFSVKETCTVGIPCSLEYINWLGFITIPFLSFVAFTLINILSVLMIRHNKKAS